jgi:hypothetical protein
MLEWYLEIELFNFTSICTNNNNSICFLNHHYTPVIAFTKVEYTYSLFEVYEDPSFVSIIEDVPKVFMQ